MQEDRVQEDKHMDSIKIETTILKDGELHLTQLPCRKGDRVEATLSILARNGENDAREKEREEALRQFQACADISRFKSSGPYPTRDEFHERS
jgi:hypothetical protein